MTWLSKHKFQAHLTAFSLMALSSIGMIFSMESENTVLTYGLLAIFVLANILAMLIK